LLSASGFLIYKDGKDNQVAINGLDSSSDSYDNESWINVNPSEEETLIKQFTVSEYNDGYFLESEDIGDYTKENKNIYFIQMLFNLDNPNFHNWLLDNIENNRNLLLRVEIDEECNYFVYIGSDIFPMVKNGEGTYVAVYDDCCLTISAYTVTGYMHIHGVEPYPHYTIIYPSLTATLWKAYFDLETGLMVIGDEYFTKIN